MNERHWRTQIDVQVASLDRYDITHLPPGEKHLFTILNVADPSAVSVILDHRTVPLHKGCKSRLVTTDAVVQQELRAGQEIATPCRVAAEVRRHLLGPLKRRRSSLSASSIEQVRFSVKKRIRT
jgi:hypothetical protein